LIHIHPSTNRAVCDVIIGFSLVQYFIYHSTYRSWSHFKISDFSGETFKDLVVLFFSVSASTTLLHSSGEIYKLHYDTIPVKSASENVSFYTSNSKMPNFEL